MPKLPYPYEDVFEGLKAPVAKLVPDLDLVKYDRLLGARLVAADGTYLGTISRDKYSPESISNQYGNYGGKYSAYSIFNKYGEYGGEYSLQSPFNKYSTTPPQIVKDDHVIGYLTANKYSSATPVFDPNEFQVWLERR